MERGYTVIEGIADPTNTALYGASTSVKFFLKPGFRHMENWKTWYLDFKKIDVLESGFHFNHNMG